MKKCIVLIAVVFATILPGCKTTGVGVQVKKSDDGYWIGIKTEKSVPQSADAPVLVQ